jgi:hypothetical protein
VEKAITECAARIIGLLGQRGTTDILSLSDYLDERAVIAYQALGWLAREGRITYVQRGSQVMVGVRAGKAPDPRRSTERRLP